MMLVIVLIITMVVLSLMMTGLVLWVGYKLLFSITMLHGPVFVPSSDDRLVGMLSLTKVKKGDRVIDLGSGDGKVVIALAQRFPDIKIKGVEINPLLVRSSQQRIKALGLEKQIAIRRQSLWDVDLSLYDTVFLYGTSYIMKKLEEKVKKEMKPGSNFISNYFTFPTLKPVQSKREVYLYKIPE